MPLKMKSKNSKIKEIPTQNPSDTSLKSPEEENLDWLYTCPKVICKKKFHSVDSTLIHWYSCHKSEKQKCPFRSCSKPFRSCSKIFNLKEDLLNHWSLDHKIG